jgi:precorrin-2 dehydrogenase/sirohydrochlorin ferrochelatase
MRTHAVFLRLEGRRCVVIGGDDVAERKALACRNAGGDVTVIAPSAYRDGDLRGAMLAYAVTDDPTLIASLQAEAAREHVLLNVVDVPAACSFFAPAVVVRGELQVAIGTGGASPTLASRIRRDLEARLDAAYGPYLAILGAVRSALPSARRAEVMERLVDSDLLVLVRHDDRAGIDALIARATGEPWTLRSLGVDVDAAEAR